MELPAGYLQVGSNINIKRTDGRVHSAIVAGINNELQSATVEWFEQGETKGKEINLAAIESLNPEIIILKPGENTKFNKLQRTPTHVAGKQIENNGLARSVLNSRLTGIPTALSNNGHTDNTLISKENTVARDTNIASSSTARQIANNELARSTVNSRLTGIPTALSNNGLTLPPADNTLISTDNTLVARDANVASSRTTSIQNTRRSNVVKEVEKLKKNREERRQRQAEEKEAKEAFMKMDPGNPHWELLNMIMEYRRGLDIKTLSANDPVEDHLITVCVRKRPLNKKEVTRKEVDVITIPSKNQLIVHEPKNKVDLTKYLDNQLFRFDYAFDETCSNELVYRYTAQPLIKTIFEGGFATCFAYGQTGSGKTHTMGGDFNGKNQECHKGIYAMSSSDVFQLANSSKYRHLNLIVSASFFEIYSGKVFDLLNNKTKLRILEDGKQQVQVVGLTEKVVASTDEVLKLIHKGNQARTSGTTFANQNSSRSHAVFQIYLRSQNNMKKIHGKFSLIDLAGNERGADTSSANRQTRMEGAEINKSLLALKECIRALGRRGAHLPFRVSKLTQVLKDSFVGSNSRTCMIAMVSPGVSSCEHTLNTLRYADRVKELGAGDVNTGDVNTNTGSEPEQEEDEEDNDLLQLQSFNENLSPELVNFHQVISELQTAEENMLDNQKQLTESFLAAYEKAVSLLQTTEEVTYDQEAYCRKWNAFLKHIRKTLPASLLRAEEINDDFMSKLTAEEQLSRKTTKRK